MAERALECGGALEGRGALQGRIPAWSLRTLFGVSGPAEVPGSLLRVSRGALPQLVWFFLLPCSFSRPEDLLGQRVPQRLEDQARGLRRLPRDEWVGERQECPPQFSCSEGPSSSPLIWRQAGLLCLNHCPRFFSLPSAVPGPWASTSPPAPCSPQHPTWLLRGPSHLPGCLRSPTRVC